MQFAGRAGVAGLHNIALDFTVLGFYYGAREAKERKKACGGNFQLWPRRGFKSGVS